MVMGNTAALASFVLIVGTCGCPYESSTPLGPPGSIDVDPALVGEWRCVDPDATPSEGQGIVTVFRFDASQYFIEIGEAGKEGRTEKYRAYGTPAGTSVVLNIREMKPDGPLSSAVRSAERDWSFLRYRIGPAGHLELWFVCEDGLKTLSEDEALRSIVARAGDDALYDEPVVCTRGSR
jgi:hypothetical protein